ncbi:MAG: hypothetical protein FWD35_01345 [Oscillospiraceae bacterium]|nr:hypothetical protein [Oscillospiraceae bacterium]
MKIIKSTTYAVIDTDPFDFPRPLEFELLCGNALLATYKVLENEQVDYRFNTKAGEKILTSTNRPLELKDIYFLFSSRVFPDKTPFTQAELTRFGLTEYNPYEILRRTHGIMPADRYWIRFAGEDLTHKKALEWWGEYYKPVEEQQLPEIAELPAAKTPPQPEHEDLSGFDTLFSLDAILEQKSNEYSSINDVGSILRSNKTDVSKLAANIDSTPITESAFAPGRPMPPPPPVA